MRCPKCQSEQTRVRSSWARKLTGDRQVSMECRNTACRHEWLALEPRAHNARLRRA